MSLNLLEKTELWIDGLVLENADLTEMASRVAKVLTLPEDKVMVVDVRPDHVTFDLLVGEIDAEQLYGTREALLDAVASVKGVTLTEDTAIHTDGILGLICADPGDRDTVLSRIASIREEVAERVAKRAIVFPTGFELEQGLIKDTNTPYLTELLNGSGYTAVSGEVIPDDEALMTQRLIEAVEDGYGLIITTGGVGAEDKDHSVESVLRIDEDAAAPYILKFEQGSGRHAKDGVRICVGRSGISLLVTLPGPHDEVELAAPLLIELMERGASKEEIAEALSGALAAKWQQKHFHKHVL